jgi:hypothetical protein
MVELDENGSATESKTSVPDGGSAFVETKWSQVALAGKTNLDGSRAALEKLCAT